MKFLRRHALDIVLVLCTFGFAIARPHRDFAMDERSMLRTRH